MKHKLILSVFFASCSLPLSGATLVCSGKVETLSYHAPNKLMIQLSDMNRPVFFCNPDAEWKVTGTSYITGPDTCKTLYATFLAIKMSDKVVESMYFDGAQVPSDCQSWESWNYANIRHFKIK
ncbi:hypothetical protein J8L86_12600 [Shewanella sp. MMG014]|uniref:hypothetical protein n=1 Tax=Shewanella sp. MMG014 TaxID=2822691 RepID=UPI001B3938EA|nr:hypothetical protein [Shewanella sp. MMG014]MBQ4890692.1 hypothetical protein [Shewanella sp. MMG014]